MGPSSSVNNFFGVKVSQVGVPVNQANDKQLTYKLDYNTGVQTFYGTNSTLNFGSNPDGTLGLNVQNNNNQLLFELSGETWQWYDTDGNIVMMVGYLPVTGVYGWAVAATGQSLAGQV